MSILRKVKAGWISLTPVEKIKMVLGLMARLGAGYIAGDIVAEYAGGKKLPEQVLITVGGTALGMVAGDVAAKATDTFVDDLVYLNDLRKEMKKGEKKEAV